MPLPVILAALGRAAAGVGRAVAAGARGAAKVATSQNANALTNALFQANFIIPSLTSGFKALAGAMLPLALPIKLASGLLGGFREVVSSVGEAVAGFVQLASPAHVQKFQLAVDDLTASIGKALIPVLEYGTKIVRFFADVLFELSDPMQRLLRAVMDPLIKSFDRWLAVAEPFIAVLGDMIDALASVIEFISKLDAEITKFLGINLSGSSRLSDRSVGAAVRPAQITSVEDYGRRAQTAAFSLGSAASPAERTADATERIANFIVKLPEELAKAIVRFLPGGSFVVDGLGGDDSPGLAAAVRGGERRGRGLEARIDRLHSEAVGTIEDTFGITLPSFR